MRSLSKQVGPYLLVRLRHTPDISIYKVGEDDTPVATLWRVEVSHLGVPEEWRIRCSFCTDPPSPSRAESRSKGFTNRDRALQWLRLHRSASHPPTASTEEAS